MKKMNVKLLALMLFAAVPAFAQEAGGNAAWGFTGGMIAIGAGICMGIAVLGGTLGQSKVASAALDGSARNPDASGKFMLPLILGLALIESLVLFAFLIANGMSGVLVSVMKKLFSIE